MAGGANESVFAAAYAVATGLLMMEPRITQEALERAVATVVAMPNFVDIDADRLRRELETNNNVHVAGYSVIDDRDFKAWIQSARETRQFAFWNRYRKYLELRKRMPHEVVEQLDGLTDDILDRLRDPHTDGEWGRRGLVVGDVQSGKTSNYTGLICKAVDAGYPLVIVLAGVHNSLRSQTQIRLDEGFFGFDTRLNLRADQENQRIGAGALPGAPFLVAHSLTSSSDSGDFRLGTAQGTKVIPGGKDPVVLVVKKRVSILDNLYKWLAVRSEKEESMPGGRVIRGVPLLMIDDEADYASANTNEFRDSDGKIDEDANPTNTNKYIRRLLTLFEKSAYVGYTATPFANVFIHHEGWQTDVGEDLFPRSFIINIPAPTNYLGADKVFGLDRPGTDGESDGLPIIRPVLDAEPVFPPKHNKELLVAELPASLHEAILAFILACAARRARGDISVDNSMLVHVTRFTLVQQQVARLIDETMTDIRRQLEYPGTGGDALDRLETLWRNDFEAHGPLLRSMLEDHKLPPIGWDAVRAELFDAARRITVRQINGSAKDALDYAEHPDGLSVIAVGGDKLSRGLTLEGLSVSYFVRTSRMYDTLMQMGRWFGYRPGYADLCRLYTSPELVLWYRHIAVATSELREEFDLMYATGQTPDQFGNRVRAHPDGMLITAANKMRAAQQVRAGFSGTISETVSFDISSAERNLEAFSNFLTNLPTAEVTDGRYVWDDVSGVDIAALMTRVETSRESWKANSRAISDYISDRVANGALEHWTVALLAGGRSGDIAHIGPYKVSLIKRTNKSAEQRGKYTIGRLVSPADEMIDLGKEEVQEALRQTIKAWEMKKPPKRDQPRDPSGPFIRRQRDSSRGLLLIYPIGTGSGQTPLMGIAVSFPWDVNAREIEYAENSVKQLEELFE
ncbi:Z1 domain-containing protein [Manganibacter manganicus]|uniref:Putative endonuclease Z1 domain-containing protein n=1 Tax=Manganibacter manganicus TaxID=1873176 RepID=A0A1V8RU56_9HYPH|nr:Z1 domain-containing protein [Pseudaminobacter manganicus]OQM76695.1 hypothetical protein BFN67_12325 [Pseudaminobacter manganicus]